MKYQIVTGKRKHEFYKLLMFEDHVDQKHMLNFETMDFRLWLTAVSYY